MFISIAAYHFVAIDDPGVVAAHVRARAMSDGLLGTVLVAAEGINLFLAGNGEAIDAFLGALREDPRFATLQAKRSRSDTAPFARLKVKVKPEIISFRRHDASPLDGRAPSVTPHTLARWLESGRDDDGRRVVLLDTRNREEVGHGSFSGAVALPIDNFTDLPEALDAHREALADATVVGFCTGGIRCEKAVPWMRVNGFAHALQLDGGILGYFEQVGGFGYDGHCFVFDERVALDPALRPVTAPEGARA
ncbi:sulfurtransferase [Luteimonas sp. MC1825]|uniref:sulfurtransferase n=1 Tax=Luteimonas sp. MC1825 TaxID=2761107 RepID=UPI0016188638|nr:sulfurtransferase [Luteimonas sp. MC1825]MBB6599492.1 sulfurtransferase [Luteimonas sp. MC1825]QOC87191.1 sulfurtransferase [Luteimonas sp. MC1825]